MNIPNITNRCAPADIPNTCGLFMIAAKIPLHITAKTENTINPTLGGSLRRGECSIVIILFHPSFKTSHNAVGGNAFTLPFISYPLH